MYKNTGLKILAMANTVAIILIIISVILGIGIGFVVGQFSGALGFAVFLVISAVGCTIAWVYNLLLTGFGELISSTSELLSIAKTHTAHTVEQPGAGADMPNVIREYSKNTGVTNHIGNNNRENQPVTLAAANYDPLVRRAFIALEDGDWNKASELFEQALNLEPENARVYIGKLCVELRIKSENDLLSCELPINDNNNYKRAIQFADGEYRALLESYALTPMEQELQRTNREEDEKRKERDFNSFVETAKSLHSTKDIFDEFQTRNLGLSEESLNSLHEQLKELSEVERLYGNNKQSALKRLNSFLEADSLSP